MVAIKNLVPWGGHDFNYVPGEVVDADAETAAARVGAGLAEYAPGAAGRRGRKTVIAEPADAAVDPPADEPPADNDTLDPATLA